MRKKDIDRGSERKEKPLKEERGKKPGAFIAVQGGIRATTLTRNLI